MEAVGARQKTQPVEALWKGTVFEVVEADRQKGTKDGEEARSTAETKAL